MITAYFSLAENKFRSAILVRSQEVSTSAQIWPKQCKSVNLSVQFSSYIHDEENDSGGDDGGHGDGHDVDDDDDGAGGSDDDDDDGGGGGDEDDDGGGSCIDDGEEDHILFAFLHKKMNVVKGLELALSSHAFKKHICSIVFKFQGYFSTANLMIRFLKWYVSLLFSYFPQEMHLGYVISASNLLADVYGITQNRDESFFLKVLQTVHVPEFTPKAGECVLS